MKESEDWQISVFAVVEQKFTVKAPNQETAQLEFERQKERGEITVEGVEQRRSYTRLKDLEPGFDPERFDIRPDGSGFRAYALQEGVSSAGATKREALDKLNADLSRRNLRGVNSNIRTDRKDPLHDTTGI